MLRASQFLETLHYMLIYFYAGFTAAYNKFDGDIKHLLYF